MSDIIQLLPDSVANQIAAGEVIQRPASVVKELVENSIDAGAANIQVLVEDAGRTSIQVVDDGKGMSETDARLSFERHATSKIRSADDLFSLHTMGFRGEALPSIAAVAQLRLRTRQQSEDIGTELMISGSRLVEQKPCYCPVGCNFTVENIFYNVPARRKFLKSNATELNNIITTFERIALVYPGIAFALKSNGGDVFNLRPANLLQRILDIFGKKINQDLLPVQVDTTLCKIKGFVGKPEAAKKKCTQQYFFVNGRFMKHAYFAKAVQTAFEKLLPVGEQVPYFIYFDVNPSDIDVNIHPTKTEIKFENEQAIWQILAAAVRESIGVFNAVPRIDFDVQGQPDIPLFDANAQVERPRECNATGFNPFASSSTYKPKPSTTGWEQLYARNAQSVQSPADDLFGAGDVNASSDSPLQDKASDHYQHKGCYVVTSVRGGLLVVDQHRAHVRVLYEQYMRRMAAQKSVSQRMLFPEAVQFEPCDAALLDLVVDEMAAMGFELTPLGAYSYAINAVPAGMEGVNPSTLVSNIVGDVIESGSKVKDEINHTLALGMARRAAIPYGQVLGNEEMDDLLNKLFECSNVNYTPDGKTIYALIRQNDIEGMF